jgi:ketosteroid isomerase-like protein
MEDIRAAVSDHAMLFNDAVRSGNFAEFVATFTDDAIMRFENRPLGPYYGRDAIAKAYAAVPPTDTMTLEAVEAIGTDAARVTFAWDAGGTGQMTMVWRDGKVADLSIALD